LGEQVTRKPSKPQLNVVQLVRDLPPAPPDLGEHGHRLWTSITAEYEVSDAAGLVLLEQAAQAADRVAALRAVIDQQGEVAMVRGQPKAHPALRDELQGRAFIARTLDRLNLQPLQPNVGRPAGSGKR
jgi:hypothetical protein